MILDSRQGIMFSKTSLMETTKTRRRLSFDLWPILNRQSYIPTEPHVKLNVINLRSDVFVGTLTVSSATIIPSLNTFPARTPQTSTNLDVGYPSLGTWHRCPPL